jgi:hypothetical protein
MDDNAIARGFGVGSGTAAKSVTTPRCETISDAAEKESAIMFGTCVQGGKKRRSAKRRKSVKGKKRGGRKSRKC